jgi:hypothetical protein
MGEGEDKVRIHLKVIFRKNLALKLSFLEQNVYRFSGRVVWKPMNGIKALLLMCEIGENISISALSGRVMRPKS